MIGDDIEIVVASIEGNTVKIGIKAPRDIKILRKETFDQVKLENIRAVEAAALFSSDMDKVLPRGFTKDNTGDEIDKEEG